MGLRSGESCLSLLPDRLFSSSDVLLLSDWVESRNTFWGGPYLLTCRGLGGPGMMVEGGGLEGKEWEEERWEKGEEEGRDRSVEGRMRQHTSDTPTHHPPTLTHTHTHTHHTHKCWFQCGLLWKTRKCKVLDRILWWLGSHVHCIPYYTVVWWQGC